MKYNATVISMYSLVTLLLAITTIGGSFYRVV